MPTEMSSAKSTVLCDRLFFSPGTEVIRMGWKVGAKKFFAHTDSFRDGDDDQCMGEAGAERIGRRLIIQKEYG
jgi:hypothetical protein